MNEVRLKVPFLSQLDNNYEPFSTCNVTSVAMCLAYFGHQKVGVNGDQLEDELTDYCYGNHLERRAPLDLKKLIEDYGYADDFQSDANWESVKGWLDGGNPAIVHGYFTKSGHIICIIGYNSKGFVVHDPYGEWFESGYDTLASGAGLTYSYAMMERVCGANGDLWIHFVSK